MPKLNTEERGQAIELGFWSTEGELLDRSEPTIREYEYMRLHSSVIQAMELAISLPLQGASWRIDEGPDDKGEAEKVRDWLTRSQWHGGMSTPMQDVINQQTEGPFTKRVYFEKVVKRNEDRSVTYKKLAWRPPTTCMVRVDKENGSFNGFVQRGIRGDGQPFVETFTPEEAFVYIHRNEKRPFEGASLFQTAFGDYEDNLKVQRLWNIHLQKFALATALAKYRGNERNGLSKLFKKTVEWLGGGGVMGLDRGEELEIVSKNGAGTEFEQRAAYLDKQMLLSCLALFLQLPGRDVGSWALSSDQSDFFLQALEAILRDMAQALTSYVLAPLVRWNFGDGASYPIFAFESLAENQVQTALDVWQKLIVSANRPQGKLWVEMTRLASERMGIDWDSVKDDFGVDEEGVPTQEPVPGINEIPSLGNGQNLRTALNELVTFGESGNGSPLP